jgi:putative transcriptional regulator
MMRVRLKADGRIVEILPDGSERALGSAPDPSQHSARLRERGDPAPRSEQMPTGFSLVQERTEGAWIAPGAMRDHSANGHLPPADAVYAKGVRASTRLTQAEFAARIGVPIETVRNWEQGKRSPRGPARALLKVIERAPDAAFAALSPAKPPA